MASLAGSHSRFSMRRQSRRQPWWGPAQGLTGGLSGFQSHLHSCRQASKDPHPSAPTWASREGRLTPRQLASPAGGMERAPDRSHSPSITQPFPPSLPTYSFCCKSLSGPHSQKGKTQSCESPEGGDRWEPCQRPPTSGATAGTDVERRPARLWEHLRRRQGGGPNSSLHFSPRPGDSKSQRALQSDLSLSLGCHGSSQAPRRVPPGCCHSVTTSSLAPPRLFCSPESPLVPSTIPLSLPSSTQRSLFKTQV